jgi:iron complex transport system ATP-binding protein
VEKLSTGYQDRAVLKDLSLELREGELLVLAGPNGSGKTTLLKTIAGLIKPRSGRILIRGRDLGTLPSRERAALLAFLFQESGPRWPFTVEELASQGRFRSRAAPGDREALGEALKASGLLGFEDRPVTELSGGEFQRVLIARALFQGAPLLLLDEPANNLDPRYQNMVMSILKTLTTRGLSALVSLHDLNLAALYADRVALLSGEGLRALGVPKEVFAPELLEEVFQAPLGVGTHPEAPRIPLVYPRFPVSRKKTRRL